MVSNHIPNVIRGECIVCTGNFLLFDQQVLEGSWEVFASTSCLVFLLSGVPRGSVLGPLVFTMYTHPLGIIAQRYGVKYQLYADDIQLYISLDPDNELNFSYSLTNLEHCIADIWIWMTQNLNDNKTNLIHCVKSRKTPQWVHLQISLMGR